MDRRRPARDRAAAGWSRLDTSLPRRTRPVQAAGFAFQLDCLDDLDAAIDATFARAASDRDTTVAEICPHFGVLWPAAVGLCEALAERWTAAAGTVLELGCGLALPSMVARRLGAPVVVATDRHPLVPHFLARNAQRNGIAGIDYKPLDWRQAATHPDPLSLLGEPPFDLVIGSDLLYEPWQPGFLAHLLPRLLKHGGTALVADPGRRHVDSFRALLDAEGLDAGVEHYKVANGRATVGVLVLEIKAR
jgi:predicted nicotinamide N-methyase